MKKPEPKPAPPPEVVTAPPFAPGVRRWWSRFRAFQMRDVWWQLLNWWEAHRWFRRSLYGLAATGVVALALWHWAYPAWLRKNSIAMARQWIAVGKLHHAAVLVQKASVLMPERPEPWQLAAELARRGGQQTLAVRYARRASRLAPDDPTIALDWAAEALRANLPDEAALALKYVPSEVAMNSAYALRVRGELARRHLQLTVAENCFEAALRIEGPLAINQVPLGLILLRSTHAKVRQRGLRMLAKWTADEEWGPPALRALLDDAFAQGDKPAIRRWGEMLRTHPRCTIGDMPNCLRALAVTDEPYYREVLQELERDHAVTPQAAAQLLGWLNQIGRPADAVSWMQSLPAPAMQTPPLAVLAAEALRATASWEELAERTAQKDWGKEFEFLRWAYALQAAQALGHPQRADELRQTLFNHTQLNGVHALFIASTLYSWGQTAEAEHIWWQAASQGGNLAVESLGALGRHYQLQRDAEGQYRVFRKLHFMKPADDAIGNNFAFFALLLDREQRLVDKLTLENLAADPTNEAYVATRAFALLAQNETEPALALLQPLAARAPQSPALAFAYGLTLAKVGRQAEARPLLQALPPASLTWREVELISAALGD
ncbi:MAG: hypothetical protein KBF26_09460 [Opitutaceae bacterium]|nr:hypothetical protein [Opitutaceae bacterium]